MQSDGTITEVPRKTEHTRKTEHKDIESSALVVENPDLEQSQGKGSEAAVEYEHSEEETNEGKGRESKDSGDDEADVDVEGQGKEKGSHDSGENEGEDKNESLCKKMFGNRDVPDDIYEEKERLDGGKQTVRQDSMESLALHLVYVAFSCFFGYVILRLLWLIEYNVPALEEIKFFTSFPLFPWCMLGGLFVMWVHETCGSPAPIDPIVMDRIGGASMEFLIVSAIAVINTDAVADDIVPLIIIMIGGVTWNFICFFILAKRVLPNFHFERGIVELGQSFGTTSTGLLLLRMCDPDKETPVWAAFGYKQMMTEPFMGGGIWTTVSLQLLVIIGEWGVFGIAMGFLAFWTGMYFFYFRKVYAKAAAELGGKKEE